MLKWQRRIAANSVKAIVPFQNELRKLKHAIRPPVPGRHHELVLNGIIEQIAMIRAAGGQIEGARVLEIGSGWIPVAPLVYRLAGAREVILSDQHHLLHPHAVQAAVTFLRARAGRLAADLGVSPERIAEVLDVPLEGGADAMLAALGLDYIVPLSAETLTGRIDLAYSHTVLEHIPPAALAEIFALVRARLAEGGLFCNGIDNSDHRRCYDADLPIVDFLRYSDRAWRMQCINPQDYTNRLRHSDYVTLLEEAGFDLLHARRHVAREALSGIAAADLPERFRDKAPEDLCTTWSLMLARA
jgi:SAM-dependent methyltransferase